GALSGTQKLSTIKSTIDSAANTLGFTSSEEYRGAATAPHDLEVLLKLSFDKTGSLPKALDFGAQGQALGLTVTGALNFTIQTEVSGWFELGATTDTSVATPFLDPSSNISFHLHAATGSVSDVDVHLSFLDAKISGSATLDGTVKLQA